ncbi:MAG TPA: hypothetical protein PLY34_03795 [Ferruginibacter sp.]|nr:hypothetical protein [Ferruginibacter sp.]HPH90683.1 hypothetical protein [Ferruginibacter sp.]
MQKQTYSSVIIASILVLLAAISRVAMYPDNFSPMIGMAIFGGAVIKDKRMAFALPLFAMLLSDIMFEVFDIAQGFWGLGQLIGYGIFALITMIAFNLKKFSVLNIAGYSIMSSVIFFVLSNGSFFFIDNPVYHTYTQDLNGFFQCYISALPFFKTSVVADLVYSGLLFGIYALVQKFAFRRAIA